MPADGFRSAFAPNGSAELTAVLAATQRPIALACIQEPMKAPACNHVPSWFLIAEDDRMINAATQRFGAARMRARIRSHSVDNTPLLTAPEHVSSIIREAVDASAILTP